MDAFAYLVRPTLAAAVSRCQLPVFGPACFAQSGLFIFPQASGIIDNNFERACFEIGSLFSPCH
jgi:hypothetical protein